MQSSSEPIVDAPLVLVAEDHEDNRRIAVTILQHGGYRTAEATNGAEAVTLARALRPALIVMDVGMPEVDGWSATRTLRGDASCSPLLIIACTAHARDEDSALAMEAGCDAFLTKPIAPSHLLQVVRRLLPLT